MKFKGNGFKYFPLRKVDEAAHMVWGVATSETPDSDKEICDYEAAKAAIKTWSDETFAKTTAAGQDPSLGNMRIMHQLQIGGKAIRIEYHDADKEVWVGSEPADDAAWHLLKGGFLTAHSIGGSYAWQKPEGEYTRYGPIIGEISYVDKPANADATFAYVKADGSTELRKFAKLGPEEVETIHKIELSALSTHLEKISVRLDSLVRQENADGDAMNKAQIEACAKALGITPEEFIKTFIEGEVLLKGKGGLAALHAHLKKAVALHEKMHTMHKAMAEHHAALGEHLENCMKAHGACMDGAEADKILRAAAEGLEKVEKKEPVVAKTDAEITEMVKTQVAEGMKAFKTELENKKVEGVRVIPRMSDEEFGKARQGKTAAELMDPMAV